MTLAPWLHGWFAAAAVACALLLGVAVTRESGRAAQVSQRLVPALGVVDRCETCHDSPKHSEVVADHHPPERFGCTPCHGGQGMATTARAAHLASPDWDRPLFSPAERDAACGSCHQGRDAPIATVAVGRKALIDRGCSGCHAIPGVPAPDFAPELDGLRDAVSPGFVRAWLRNPEALDSHHRMPTFRLSAADIEALVAHLWTLPGPDLQPLPDGGDAERGRTIVAQRRCATCHRVDGRGGDTGPDLALAGSKLAPTWLWNLLTDTHRLRPHTRMPGFRMSGPEAADVVAYAREEWLPDSGQPPWQQDERPVVATLAPRGKALFAELGCGGCHRVAGQLQPPVALTLAHVGDRRVADLPRLPNQRVTTELAGWLARKIQVPTVFDAPRLPPSRMPTFPHLEPQEAQAMGIALASLHGKGPPEPWIRHHDPAPAPVPPGETGRLVQRYRCLVCHQLGGQGGSVAHIPLDGAGARLRRPWLDRFLQAPVTVRMDQPERMPVLGITPEEARQLADWIAGSLGDDRVLLAEVPTPTTEGPVLYTRYGCGACHVAAGGGTMKGPTLDGAGHRLQPGYVLALLRDPTVVPEHRHPGPRLPDAEARTLAAYVLALPGVLPWPDAPHRTGDPSP